MVFNKIYYLCTQKPNKPITTIYMENKIILFSNVKGGVGKSTLCSLFATYCAEKGIPTAVVDADLQQSLVRQRKREKEHFRCEGSREHDGKPEDNTRMDPGRLSG